MTLLLEVKIPTLPPSVNAVYAPVSVGPTTSRRGFNTIRMKKEATTWIQQATLFLPPVKLPKDSRFRMELAYHSNWYTKEGKPKIRDVRNYEKLVSDTIFRRYGLNDCMIWESLVTKIQNMDWEGVVVRLYEISPS